MNAKKPTGSPPKHAASPPAAAPSNSIRMDQAKLNRFLDERDADSKSDKNPRRGFVRWPFRNACIAMTVTHPGGSSATFNVACRNLSSGGLGVLHSAYVHKGTRCTVELPATDGQTVSVEGAVVRCVHVSGTIHEVGVQFSKPIDPKLFIALDPFSNGFSLETVDPVNLRGTVLYVEDSSLDQTLVRHFLRETQIHLIIVPTAEEGLAKALEGVDLIMCDQNLGGGKGSEFVHKARTAGLSQPILMVTADTSPATRAALAKAKATAFVTKPLKQETLFRALAEFMVVSASAGGISSSLPENHANIGLLETFVDEIKQHAGQLESAIEEGNTEKARSLCLQIIGSAPVMGFETLAELARTAEAALDGSNAITDAAVPLRTLVSACQRTSARRAA